MQTQDFTTSSMQRVKVYRLNPEGTWDDKGTGNVSVEYLEMREMMGASQNADSMGMVVIAEEEPNRTLLIHRIAHDENYQRQGDMEYQGVSEVGQCLHNREKIQLVQAKFDRRHQENGRRRIISDEFEQATLQQEGDYPDSSAAGPVELPAPDMEHLPDLAKVLSELSPFQRDRAAQQMLANGYIRRLLDVFRTCEDLENTEALAHLYTIVKGAIMLNETTLLEVLLNEENVMDVVGALEYEPEVPEHMRVRHREFLRDRAVFKEVVPINDPSLRARIHQTYRLGYMKDVILPRVLDDGTFATLSSIMLFNNVEVVLALMGHARFLPDLFQRLKSSQPGQEMWHDSVAFLQEMCGMARYLSPSQRSELYSKLVSLGLFDVLTNVMSCGDVAMRLRATDVLHSMVQHDALPLREFIMSQSEHSLFTTLLQPYLEGGDPGIQLQTLDMLRVLLDSEACNTTAPEVDKFLDVFYKDNMGKLVAVINGCTEADSTGKLPDATALGHIVELFNYCVSNHAYRIKYFVLRNNLVEKVLKLLHRKEKWLVIAAVRFLRACLSAKDDFYNRYLVRNNLFDDIIDIFMANGDRYNLLNSALLDVFEFIRKENVKSLVQHIVEKYGERLDAVEYVDTFKRLRITYEQNMDRDADPKAPGSPSNAPAVAAANRRRRDAREMDRDGLADEEDYFDREDDDNLSTRDTQEREGEYLSILLLTPNGRADEEDYFDREDDDDDGDRDAAAASTPGPSAPVPPASTSSHEDGSLPNGTVIPQPEIGPALPAALSVLSEYGQDGDEEQEDEDQGSPGRGGAERKRSPNSLFVTTKRSRLEDDRPVASQPLKQGTVSTAGRA